MLILAIDNSLDHLNFAVARDDMILAQSSIKGERSPSEVIGEETSRILSVCQKTIDEVETLFVTLGPGSFTGIRVSLAFAKGIAAAGKVQLVGVPTLDVLAAALSSTSTAHLCPLIDAKKGEVFTAIYKVSPECMPQRITPYRAIKPEDLAGFIPLSTLCFGSGAVLCESILSTIAGVVVEKEKYRQVSLEAFIKTGLALMKGAPSTSAVPIYCRKSEAEIRFNVSID